MTAAIARAGSSFSRQPRPHAAWSRFVEVMKAEMSEEELASLTLDTVRSLATHVGLSGPLDIAHIELAWGERQTRHQDSPTQALNGTATSIASQDQLAGSKADGKEASHNEAPKTTPAGNRGKSLRPGSGSATKNGPNGTLTKTNSGKFANVQSKVAEQIRAPSPPRADSPTKRDSTGDPNGKIVRKDVPSRVDSGKIRRSTSFDADEVICVEDLKEVFTRYASFANGNPRELDASRFAKLCKECDLIDKLFTLREADVLFVKSKKSAADRRIPYHVFRMKLLPEMAAKKHCSISDIVKLCNHHGGPEIRQRPEPVAEPVEEVEAPPPPPPVIPELAKRTSSGKIAKNAGAAPELEKRNSSAKMVKTSSAARVKQ